jgi:hypothetical protein
VKITQSALYELQIRQIRGHPTKQLSEAVKWTPTLTPDKSGYLAYNDGDRAAEGVVVIE